MYVDDSQLTDTEVWNHVCNSECVPESWESLGHRQQLTEKNVDRRTPDVVGESFCSDKLSTVCHCDKSLPKNCCPANQISNCLPEKLARADSGFASQLNLAKVYRSELRVSLSRNEQTIFEEPVILDHGEKILQDVGNKTAVANEFAFDSKEETRLYMTNFITSRPVSTNCSKVGTPLFQVEESLKRSLADTVAMKSLTNESSEKKNSSGNIDLVPTTLSLHMDNISKSCVKYPSSYSVSPKSNIKLREKNLPVYGNHTSKFKVDCDFLESQGHSSKNSYVNKLLPIYSDKTNNEFPTKFKKTEISCASINNSLSSCDGHYGVLSNVQEPEASSNHKLNHTRFLKIFETNLPSNDAKQNSVCRRNVGEYSSQNSLDFYEQVFPNEYRSTAISSDLTENDLSTFVGINNASSDTRAAVTAGITGQYIVGGVQWNNKHPVVDTGNITCIEATWNNDHLANKSIRNNAANKLEKKYASAELFPNNDNTKARRRAEEFRYAFIASNIHDKNLRAVARRREFALGEHRPISSSSNDPLNCSKLNNFSGNCAKSSSKSSSSLNNPYSSNLNGLRTTESVCFASEPAGEIFNALPPPAFHHPENGFTRAEMNRSIDAEFNRECCTCSPTHIERMRNVLLTDTHSSSDSSSPNDQGHVPKQQCVTEVFSEYAKEQSMASEARSNMSLYSRLLKKKIKMTNNSNKPKNKLPSAASGLSSMFGYLSRSLSSLRSTYRTSSSLLRNSSSERRATSYGYDDDESIYSLSSDDDFFCYDEHHSLVESLQSADDEVR